MDTRNGYQKPERMLESRRDYVYTYETVVGLSSMHVPGIVSWHIRNEVVSVSRTLQARFRYIKD
jgi:hypothetical protein